MINIKSPERYVSEEGLLAHSGELIASLGRRKALVLGGKTALAVAGPDFFQSLEEADIKYDLKEFTGYPTPDVIAAIAREIAADGTELVIGVGGGRVLDVAKAAADPTDIPVVTVPTIAATCAAWSAVTITYNDSGAHAGVILLKRSPQLVLADTTVLAGTPRRYIAAGIGDTLVKWYEAAPNVGTGPDSISARVGLVTAKLALDILVKYAREVYRTTGTGQTTPAFQEVVDSIIFLAGQVGSLSSRKYRAAIAHTLNNSLTHFEATRGTLHGEKVAFGLIVQLFLEGQDQLEIERIAGFLHELNLPVTLGQLGFSGDGTEEAGEIARNMHFFNEAAVKQLPFAVNRELLEKAILDANNLGQRLVRAKNASA